MEAQALVSHTQRPLQQEPLPVRLVTPDCKAQEHERRLERAQGQEALKHAIAAAELYMQAAARAKTPAERSRLNRRCADLIRLGERLKANVKAAAALSRRPAPESTRPLTTAEKIIVLKASRLHGNVYPPWDAEPGPEHFSRGGGTGDAYMCVDASLFMPAAAMAHR